jgi:hypothetical protein
MFEKKMVEIFYHREAQTSMSIVPLKIAQDK